jgi:glycine cleavage system H protein
MVSIMNIPEGLKYSKEHEWVRVEGSVARVGITDHAQDALGDIVFVDLPKVGDTVSSGQNFGEIESTKSVSEIYAPLGGTVTAVNAALESNPDLLNKDPYGEGWICEVTGFDSASLDSLLDAAGYRDLIGG